jgi:hypothetical protein
LCFAVPSIDHGAHMHSPHAPDRWNLDSQLPQPVRIGTDVAANAATAAGDAAETAAAVSDAAASSTECLRAYLQQQLATGAHLLLVTRPAGSSGSIVKPGVPGVV